MAKKPNDIVFDNMKGFFRVGASTRSPGNIPTGHLDLDFILHYGYSPKDVDLSTLEGYDPTETLGLPLGKLVELFGEEASGKSSLAYRVCGFAQKMGYEVVWIDAENSFSDALAEINGMNKEEVIFSDLVNDDNPDNMFCAEDIFDGIVHAIKQNANPKKKKKVGVIVLDSVANLLPKARMEKDAEEHVVGVVARLMSENLKKIVNYAAKYGVLVIFINQLREKIGVMFGNPETTPGGKALRYNASVRLRVGKGGKDRDIKRKDKNGKEQVLGRKALVRIEKNRFAKPYRETIEVPIYYEPVFIDIDNMIFNASKQLKIVKPHKDEFRWKNGGVAAVGEDGFMQAIKMKGLKTQLIQEIGQVAGEQGIILPPELVKVIEDAELGELPEDAVVNTSVDDDEDTSNEVDAEGLVEDVDDVAVAKPTRRKRETEDSSESE